MASYRGKCLPLSFDMYGAIYLLDSGGRLFLLDKTYGFYIKSLWSFLFSHQHQTNNCLLRWYNDEAPSAVSFHWDFLFLLKGNLNDPFSCANLPYPIPEDGAHKKKNQFFPRRWWYILHGRNVKLVIITYSEDVLPEALLCKCLCASIIDIYICAQKLPWLRKIPDHYADVKDFWIINNNMRVFLFTDIIKKKEFIQLKSWRRGVNNNTC